MPRIRGTGSAVTVTTTSETVLATLPGISLTPSQPVDLIASIDFSTGTGVTAVTFKIERGTVAGGTAIATVGPIAIAASTRALFCLCGVDQQAAEVAGQQYVITATQAGATGNGTGNTIVLRGDWGYN